MPIYMQYEKIEGDVTSASHEKWIELHSFQWGVGRGISSKTGRGADREASAPSISEITVTKSQDKSTTKLLDEALQGESNADMTTEHGATGLALERRPIEFLQMTNKT